MLLAALGLAQTAGSQDRFEVASVKPAPPLASGGFIEPFREKVLNGDFLSGVIAAPACIPRKPLAPSNGCARISR